MGVAEANPVTGGGPGRNRHEGAPHPVPGSGRRPAVAGWPGIGGGALGGPVSAALGGALVFGGYLALHLARPAALSSGRLRMAALLGIYLGFPGLDLFVLGLALAMVLAALAGVALLASGRARRADLLPLAPFLAAGALGALVWRPPLLGCGWGRAAAPGRRAGFGCGDASAAQWPMPAPLRGAKEGAREDPTVILPSSDVPRRARACLRGAGSRCRVRWAGSGSGTRPAASRPRPQARSAWLSHVPGTIVSLGGRV